MLFEYGKFWQSLTILFFTWILYALFGFEFACITLLSAIVISMNL
jgi:hypothetical protein